MFRFPLLTKILKLKIKNYAPDHVIISSFAAAKNVAPTQNPKLKTHNISEESLTSSQQLVTSDNV